MNKYKDKNSFTIILDKGYFNKKDILLGPDKAGMIVTKAYKFTWWKKILFKLGFKIRFYDLVKEGKQPIKVKNFEIIKEDGNS